MIEEIVCRGHPNIMSTHRTTIEVTKEAELSSAGDCIVGVCADRGMGELPEGFRKVLKGDCEIEIRFECGGIADTVHAQGSQSLILNHSTDMVIRKSNYICGRTLAVGADKAAADLKRELVENLKKGLELRVTLSI